jgi:hypothetical protein
MVRRHICLALLWIRRFSDKPAIGTRCPRQHTESASVFLQPGLRDAWGPIDAEPPDGAATATIPTSGRAGCACHPHPLPLHWGQIWLLLMPCQLPLMAWARPSVPASVPGPSSGVGATLLAVWGGGLEAWSSGRKLSSVWAGRVTVAPRTPHSSLEASLLNPMLPADDAKF